jgi:predicted metalloendopeptidase
MPAPRRLAAGAVLAAAAVSTLGAPAGAQSRDARRTVAVPVSRAAGRAAAGTALGVDTTAFDRSVRPQDDFFRFVNGGWLARTEIPADRSSWGSFLELRERSSDALHTILEQAARSKAPAGSNERKLGDLYASYLDSAAVEAAGLGALKDEIARLGAIKGAADLPATFARLARMGVGTPVGVGVGQDARNSEQYVVGIGQSGLGLPDRDYYLRPDPKLAAARAAYGQYITRVFTLAGVPDAQAAAGRVIAFETALAEKQWDRARNRDRNATYNRMTVAELAALTPSYDWKAYLAEAKLSAATDVVVRQPDYLRAVDTLLAATPVGTVARVPHVQAARRVRRRAALGVPERALRLPRPHAQRRQGAEPALEAGRERGRGRASASRWGRSTSSASSPPEAKARMDRARAERGRRLPRGIDSLE